MTQAFFELKTGFYPDRTLWESILTYYTSHRRDFRSPEAFCQAYKLNARGLASDIQLAANIRSDVERCQIEATIASLRERLALASGAA